MPREPPPLPAAAGHHFVHANTGSPADATPAPQNPKEAMNNLIISGRLVRPATMRNTGDKARANFTLAVDGYANSPSSFIPITCFGRTAELVNEYTDKGHLIAVEGRITSGRYTNDAGETVYALDVIAHRVEFLSRPKNATTTPDTVDADETEAA